MHDSVQQANSTINSSLLFTYLPSFAEFILQEKLDQYVTRGIELSKIYNPPILKYLSHLSEEELFELSRSNSSLFLKAVSGDKLEEFFNESIEKWKNGQLHLVENDQLVAEDITIASHLRKMLMTEFIPEYTSDLQEGLAIVKELNELFYYGELIGMKVYLKIQNDRIDEQFKSIERINSELEISTEMFKQAQSLTHIGNWSWDVENEIIIWSDEMFRIYGYEPQSREITYSLFIEHVHPADRQLVEENIEAALHNYKFSDFHYRIILDDGTEKIIHAKGDVIKDPEGNVIRIVGTGQNVTKQKSIEAVLIENQKFIEKIAKLSPSLLAVYNIHTGEYVFVNDSVRQILGYDPEAILTEGMDFFVDLIHPDDIETVIRENNEAIAAANTKNPDEDEDIIEFKYRLRNKDGEYRWLHTYGIVFDRNESGQVQHVINVSVDITNEVELQTQIENEKAFAELVVESSPYLILSYDKNFVITTWNKKSAEHSGIKKEDAIGKSIFELFPEYNNDEWISEIRRVFEGESIHYPKVKFKHSKGYGESFVIPLKNVSQEIIGLLSITNDITAIVESAELLEQKNRELEEAEIIMQSVLDASIDMITAVDEEERIIAINQKALNFGNYKREQVLGMKVLDLMPMLENDPAYGYLKRALNNEYVHIDTYATPVNNRYEESFYIPLKIHDKLKGALTLHRDITDIVNARNKIVKAMKELEDTNKQLNESRSFLQTLIDSSPDDIVVLDKQMRYMLMNTNAASSVGTNPVEIVGKSIADIFPDIEKQPLYDNILKCLAGEVVRENNMTSYRNNNHHIQTVFIPLKDEDGNVQSILMTGRDITEMVKFTQELEQAKFDLEKINSELLRSEELYHKMVLDVPNYAIVLIDENGFIKNWNKGAELIKGYKSEEIIGKHFSVFYTPEDRSAGLPDQLLEIARRSGKAEYEGWRVRKDGTLYWGTIAITPLYGEDKKLFGFVKVTRDLTERKKAEDKIKDYATRLEEKNRELLETNYKLEMAREQLADDRTRVLANAIPLIVALTNAKGELEFTNQMLSDYTGADFPLLSDLGWLNFVHEDDIRHLSFALEKSIMQEKIFHGEFRLRRADGNYLWHAVLAKPLEDENGEILKWIFAFTNIHTQKLNDERKDEFMGIASHELKTPLTSIKAYVQLLRESIELNKFGDAKFLVKKADQSINRLNDLITELLDITSIQYGKLNLHVSTFDFNELIDESIGLAHSSRHVVRKNSNTKIMISGDRDRLQQVMVNLLSNAFKYSPDAKFVDVHTNIEDGMLEVRVKDYGIGIAKTDLDKIFTRFYRVEKNAHQFQGLGIGLFIASEIVQRHNGTISVHSDPEKGSEFSFKIPLKQKMQK